MTESDQHPEHDQHPGYSGTKAAKIVGISYRQLDYWARTGLVRPSLADAKGSGSRRAYSYRDLLELRVIRACSTQASSSSPVRTRSTICASTSTPTSPPRIW
ncbi:MAG: MerR family transcriptional regulator [Ilumatobacteraceae bacterium]